jgi:hypothetical protein
MVRRFMFAAASAALLTLAPIAGAAELKVLAGGSMTDSLHEIGPQFERATGHKLVFLFAGRRIPGARARGHTGARWADDNYFSRDFIVLTNSPSRTF